MADLREAIPTPSETQGYHNTGLISNREGNQLRMDVGITQWLPSISHCVFTSGVGQRRGCTLFFPHFKSEEAQVQQLGQICLRSHTE